MLNSRAVLLFLVTTIFINGGNDVAYSLATAHEWINGILSLLIRYGILSLLIRNGITCVFYGIAVNSAEVVAPDFMVECFSTTDTDGFFSCQGTPIGTMMALDCCTGNGNTFTYESQCLGCLRMREVFFSNMKMCIIVNSHI